MNLDLTMLPALAHTREPNPVTRWGANPPHSYSLEADLLLGRSSSSLLFASSRAEPTTAKDVSSRFGRRLRELRRSRDLTQVDMARRFGIDRSFISDVERGRKSISLPMLEVIALGLHVSLSELFKDL